MVFSKKVKSIWMEFQAQRANNGRKLGLRADCSQELLRDRLLKGPALGYAALACFVFGMLRLFQTQ